MCTVHVQEKLTVYDILHVFFNDTALNFNCLADLKGIGHSGVTPINCN